jgi:hypothetical protein
MIQNTNNSKSQPLPPTTEITVNVQTENPSNPGQPIR